jgi:hypothetical protein
MMNWKIALIPIVIAMSTGCSDRAAALLYGEDDEEDQKFYVNEGSGTQVIGDGNSFVEVEKVPAPTPTPSQ